MRHSSFSLSLKLLVLICGASVCWSGHSPGHAAGRAGQQPALAPAEQLFLEKVAPTLAAKCQTCHGEDGAAELDLRSRESLLKGGRRGAAMIPGSAEKSPLYLAL
ncbi:MAG TPA: c-type cytochrome domain-containing protein, partial [Blastocatellia bacterium]|nr:c-type cytochrome domain-containing protein [Blastocatellia bacterium]